MAIADDLRLARECGGLPEASARELGGTLACLGLKHPTEPDLRHARDVLSALVAASLDVVADDHPVRDPEVIGSTLQAHPRQPWQAVAVTALRRLLTHGAGVRGEVTQVRGLVAGEFALSPLTVKRHEDKLIDVLGVTIHDRLTSGPLPRTVKPPPITSGSGGTDPLFDRLGASEREIAHALHRHGRLSAGGFDAQELGAGEPSRASTGIVTWALGLIDSVPDETIAELYDEIIGWVTPGGAVYRSEHSHVRSSWTESQCLLALTARPQLVPDPVPARRLADGIARCQRGGGWSYRSDAQDDASALCTFYPLLALQRATRADWMSGLRYRRIARNAADFASSAASGAATVVERLLAVAVLHLATSGSDDPDWRIQLERHVSRLRVELTSADATRLAQEPVVDERQPLWHAQINPSLLYLHARRVLGRRHVFTQGLAARLLAEYDPILQGWTNGSAGSRPYTWTTALALRACQLMRIDIASGSLPWPLDVEEMAVADHAG